MHIYCNFIITDFLPNFDCCAAIVRNALIENVFLADSQIIFQHTKTHIAGTMEGALSDYYSTEYLRTPRGGFVYFH